jgi:hypothetical protein
MTPVLEGTLDAHGKADLASGLSAREAAEKHYDEEFEHDASPREWWRVARLPETGEPVGLVIPARNNYHHTIACIGVLPAYRGTGYIDDILVEGTRVLAGENVPRIRAATDPANARWRTRSPERVTSPSSGRSTTCGTRRAVPTPDCQDGPR